MHSNAVEFNPESISVIGLDADDTLWETEVHYLNAKREFSLLIEPYVPVRTSGKALDEIEVRNLSVYGYGIKSFMLSMQEAALMLAGTNLDVESLAAILEIGKRMLNEQLRLMPKVREVLSRLNEGHELWLITKGDLFEQHSKIERSNLSPYFHKIEVVASKSTSMYRRLLELHEVQPDEFVMIGNALRSDILPVVEIGARAVYIPHELTWEHESIEVDLDDQPGIFEIERFQDLLGLFNLSE